MIVGPIPVWSFMLAHSSSMKVIQPITEASSRSLNVFLNKPGSFSVTVPIDSQVALKAKTLSTCIICMVKFFDATTGAKLLETIPWSGLVTAINDEADGSSDTTQITANGWIEELEHRFLDKPVVYSTQAGGLIAMDLLVKANAKVDSLSRPQPTHVSPGVRNDTQTRARVFQRGQNIGAAMRELSEIENGYDYYVDPTSRQLVITPPTVFTDRTKVQFGYGVPPHNLIKVSVLEDGLKTGNRITGEGAGGASVVQDSPAFIDQVGLMMESWLSISDTATTETLGAYVGSELAFSGLPDQTLSLTPKSASESDRVPMIFYDFKIGDRVYVSADRGRTQLRRQPCRAFGASLSFDNDGNQSINSFDVAFG